MKKSKTKKISSIRSKTKKRSSIRSKTKKRSSIRSKTKKRSSIRSKTKKRSSIKYIKQKQCRKKKVSIVMGEFKSGKLKMRNKKLVTNPRQAIAIALSEADRYC